MRLPIILLTIAVAISKIAVAQNALIDKEGIAHFFSEAPLENIEATNKKALGAIDLDKGTVAVSMQMKDFHFDKSLMEEHFNENYIESEKYPKASFKGKILDFSSLDFTQPGEFIAKAEGELQIHGVSRPLTSDVEFRVTDDNIEVSTFFQVALEDHKIKIPKIVIKNIAEVVDVDTKFNFIKK